MVGDDIRDRVDHIIVVMMENRSFDHMLGYLSLPEWRLGDPTNPESMVNGIDPEDTVTWEGVDYSPFPLGHSTWTPPDYGDPPHGGSAVGWQVAAREQFIGSPAVVVGR